MRSNHYHVLDVDTDATHEQIKSAYRNKAKRLHPDRFQGGDAPFRELQEAYEVLCDPARRRSYDQELARAKRVPPTRNAVDPLSRRWPPAEPLVPTRQPLDVGEAFFGSPFPFPDTQVPGGRRRAPRQSQGTPVQEFQIQISLSPELAYHGARLRLLIPLEVECPACRGWGSDWFSACGRCLGRGALIDERPVDVAVPAHIANGSSACISLGTPGKRNVLVSLHFRINRW